MGEMMKRGRKPAKMMTGQKTAVLIKFLMDFALSLLESGRLWARKASLQFPLGSRPHACRPHKIAFRQQNIHVFKWNNNCIHVFNVFTHNKKKSPHPTKQKADRKSLYENVPTTQKVLKNRRNRGNVNGKGKNCNKSQGEQRANI